MRLIFWNCNMAFHQKIEAILPLKPDIAVISECAAPEILALRGLDRFSPETCLWMGKNPNKGLGVFAFGDVALQRAEPFFPTLDFVLPVVVTGAVQFNRWRFGRRMPTAVTFENTRWGRCGAG